MKMSQNKPYTKLPELSGHFVLRGKAGGNRNTIIPHN